MSNDPVNLVDSLGLFEPVVCVDNGDRFFCTIGPVGADPYGGGRAEFAAAPPFGGRKPKPDPEAFKKKMIKIICAPKVQAQLNAGLSNIDTGPAGTREVGFVVQGDSEHMGTVFNPGRLQYSPPGEQGSRREIEFDVQSYTEATVHVHPSGMGLGPHASEGDTHSPVPAIVYSTATGEYSATYGTRNTGGEVVGEGLEVIGKVDPAKDCPK